MASAIDRFHQRFPDTALQVNVSRHPYSFLGDSKSGGFLRSGGAATWHDGLVDYTGGTEAGARQAEAVLSRLGATANIKFRFDVRTDWQPVDSQRLLLWAGRQGKQELFMTALNRRHFENAESASERPSLLAACCDVGLDPAAASLFLDSDELVEDVWRSYGDTIHKYGIHAIPFFIFHHPASGAVGGPFRTAGDAQPWVVNGSMDSDHFLDLFTDIRTRALQNTSAGRNQAGTA